MLLTYTRGFSADGFFGLFQDPLAGHPLFDISLSWH